jgi:hypothetical protein
VFLKIFDTNNKISLSKGRISEFRFLLNNLALLICIRTGCGFFLRTEKPESLQVFEHIQVVMDPDKFLSVVFWILSVIGILAYNMTWQFILRSRPASPETDNTADALKKSLAGLITDYVPFIMSLKSGFFGGLTTGSSIFFFSWFLIVLLAPFFENYLETR